MHPDGIWYDVRTVDKVITTVRAHDSEEALEKGRQHAYMFGIGEYNGAPPERMLPANAFAVVTSTYGVHPY